MNTTGALLVGLVLGVALGFGGALLLKEESAPSPPSQQGSGVSHEACGAREAELLVEIETLREQCGEIAAGSGSGSRSGTGAGAGSGSVAAPVTTDPATGGSAAASSPQDARRAAILEMRNKLSSVRDARAGSEEVRGLILEWRALLDAEDERTARVGAWALKNLVADGKLTQADVEGFASEFRALPRGSRARAGLAAVVTRALADDTRLADWFRELPQIEEPMVRRQAVWALDESPSDALRDYVLKLTREETNADVLNSIWNEDIVLVILTRETAPRLIQAVEGRVARGDLPPKVRGRAYFAIGLAGTHAPAPAGGAIERMLAPESDEGVRAFGKGVGDAVEQEESNVQALEGLWDRHAPKFSE